MLLAELAVLLMLTKIAAIISKRFSQPAVLGQILIGVLVGPSLLGVLRPEPVTQEFAELGVIFLMFLAGLETDFDHMRSVGRPALLAAIGGTVLPMISGVLLGNLFGFFWQQALFLGTLLTATSVSISVQTLMELRRLDSDEGTAILGAAVIDDVLSVVLLTLVVGSISHGGFDQIAVLVLRMAVFFVTAYLFGAYVLPHLTNVWPRLNLHEGRVTFSLTICFLLAWLADEVGVASIIGAYLAGVFLTRTQIRDLVRERVSIIAYSLFIPIFFVNIGLSADIGRLGGIIPFVIVLSTVAVLSKLLGCAAGARVCGMDAVSSARVGVGMIPRGEVALVVASVGVAKGIIDTGVFTAIVALVVVTSIITPPLLSMAFKRGSRPGCDGLSVTGG